MKKFSEEDKTTLAAHIKANTDPDVVTALEGRNDTKLAELYNLDSSFTVWKPAMSPQDYRSALVWTEVDALTVGQARIWHWLTQGMTVSVDASDSNVRQGLSDAFASSTESRTNLLAAAKRAATIAEQIFATGTGSSGSPGTLTVSGKISTNIIGTALNNNP